VQLVNLLASSRIEVNARFYNYEVLKSAWQQLIKLGEDKK
jgi:hypothetical protein